MNGVHPRPKCYIRRYKGDVLRADVVSHQDTAIEAHGERHLPYAIHQVPRDQIKTLESLSQQRRRSFLSCSAQRHRRCGQPDIYCTKSSAENLAHDKEHELLGTDATWKDIIRAQKRQPTLRRNNFQAIDTYSCARIRVHMNTYLHTYNHMRVQTHRLLKQMDRTFVHLLFSHAK